MEITTIIIISLAIIYLIITMVRDSFKNKWYRRGYIDAALKYDTTEDTYYKDVSYKDEANKKWYDKYGFHYN